MGVSLEAWRARIGQFCAGRSSSVSCKPGGVSLSPLLLLLALPVLLSCLVIGGVELNPGPFKCPFPSCGFSSESLNTVAYHQQVHSSSKHFQYKCPMLLCSAKIFATYAGLTNHIKEIHAERPSQAGSSSGSILCIVQECSSSFPNHSDLLHHLIQHLSTNVGVKCACCKKSNSYFDPEKFKKHFECHLTERTVTQKCPVKDCAESFNTNVEAMEHCSYHLSNNISFKCPLQSSCGSAVFYRDVNNFRSHLSVKHEGWRGMKLSVQAGHSVHSGVMHATTSSENPTTHEDDDPVPMEVDENPVTSDMFFKHIAHFYFKLLAEHFLPDSTVDVIAQSLKLISELVQHQFSVAITSELKKKNMKQEDILSIINSVMSCDVLYAAHHKESPGPTFTSSHFRDEYMKKNLSYVPPQEVSLDHDKIDGAVAYLIPPYDVLQLLLKDPVVQEQVSKSFQKRKTPGLIQDYTDGSKCRSASDNERIDVIVFSDACNPANVLGSAKNKYKMNGTYWTLGNYDPEYRATVDAINLAYLVNNSYISNKNYGPVKCFKPLVKKWKELEDASVEFMGRIVKVRVQFWTGDNLGAHEIGGFTGSFSHEYFCRWCTVKRSDFRENPVLVKPFRTANSYSQDLQSLQQTQITKPNTVCYRGVKEDSVLHILENFHVCDPRLPPCIAHDIFENGVADSDLAEILSLLVQKGWFSYVSLQQSLRAFQCLGPDQGNKPAAVNPNGTKLGGHAVQNWTLIRILPFILKDLIRDEKDEIWQLYLKLKEVVEYASAPAYTEEDLKKMERINAAYMRERKRLLKSEVKPKHHFLMHYPKLIRLMGPIIHLFTLRFEAKHQFFKRVAKACKNYINLGKTMALRHQIWMAHLFSGSILSRGLLVRKQKPFNPSMYSGKVKEIVASGIFGRDPIDCDKVEMDGVKFKTGSHLLLGQSEQNCLTIGRIEAMISANGTLYLVLQKFKSTLWKDYGIHKIDQECYDVECVPFSDLKYPMEQPVYHFKDSKCFSLKHFIIN